MGYNNNNTQGTVPTAAVDVVGVFDTALNQLFPGARAMRAYVVPEAQLMEHPVEDGSVLTDFRIVLPIEIELHLFLPSNAYKTAYQQVAQLFKNATLLTITTRAGVFTQQLIQAMPTEETPETYDSLLMTLRCKQTQIFQTVSTTIAPLNPADGDTVNRGQIAPVTAQQFEASFYESWGV